MSELNPEAVVPATETPAAVPTASIDTPEALAEQPKPTETVDFWKQKAREQENRAKSNAEAARRLAEIEDSQKTEQQRLADRQAQIERERDEARAEGLRYKAAATHGISEDYFDLLGTGDEETISTRAERVGALLRDNASMKAELEALRAGKPAPINGRPIEALKPGATPSNATTEDDVLYNSLFGG
jgi:membrane protein involved in colicin uptake